MKKKGLLFLLICTMLVLVVALSACSLVTVNEERQANRVLATVTVDLVKEYGDDVKVLGNDWDYVVSMDITRRELVVTVNYAINYYMQLYSQYGMSYNYEIETLLESGLKTLKSQKYYTARAMGELLMDSKKTGRYDALYCLTAEYQEIYGKTLVPEGVLTLSERYEAIKTINDQFDTQLEGYIGETEENDRDKETSDAHNTLTNLYDNGYFVDSVEVAHKEADAEGKEYITKGLYADKFIDDSDEDTADIDYTKIYVAVTLIKDGKKTEAPVYIPVEEENLTLEEDEDASGQGLYETAKTATVSFSGRVATTDEENEDGYDLIIFKSEPVKYTLIAPRSKYTEDDEDEDSNMSKELRYVTRAAWGDATGYTEEMTELKVDIFNPTPDTYDNIKQRDAYRQLCNSFISSNIGYTEEEPDKKDVASYNNYKYYNGLLYYYESQFQTALLSAKEYECGYQVASDAIENTNGAQEAFLKSVGEEYELLVAKDKANYEYLTQEEQVTKFFETIKTTDANGLSAVYYVPIDALCEVSYKVDPTAKAYEPLFEGGVPKATVSGFFVKNGADYKKEDGQYEMTYACKNADGTYTINMFFVTHVLLNFDNVAGLADKYKAAAKDFTSDEKIEFAKKFIKQVKTNPQLESYLENYDKEKTYTPEEVFGTAESYETAKGVMAAALETAATKETSEEGEKWANLLAAFIKLTEKYDDDGGKLTDSGYLVSAGDMNNGWYQDFTDTALNMYFTALAAGIDPTSDAAVDSAKVLTEAYSDYGVHFMFITFTPLYKVTVDSNGAMAITTELDLDGSNRNKEIQESTIKTMKSKAYTDWQEKMTDEEIDKHSEVNKKNYNRMVKDLKD